MSGADERAGDSRINGVVIGAAVVAALGGLLFGFDTAVISGATAWLTTVYCLSTFMLGFTVSSALIGSIGMGRPANKFGRECRRRRASRWRTSKSN